MERQRGRVGDRREPVYFLIIPDLGINVAYELTIWNVRMLIGIIIYIDFMLQSVIAKSLGYTNWEMFTLTLNIWPLHLIMPFIALTGVLYTEEELFPHHFQPEPNEQERQQALDYIY